MKNKRKQKRLDELRWSPLRSGACMRRYDRCQVLPAVSVLFFSQLNDSTTHQLNFPQRSGGNYKLGGIGFFG